MNRGALLAGAAGLILVLVCLSWTARRPAGRAHHPRLTGVTSVPASSTRTPTWPGGTRADVMRLLPFAPGQITQAVRMACAFTAAYTTHRYDQTPEEYLQHLAPMTTPQLHAVIERAGSDPAVLNQRQRIQEVSVGRAGAEAIRTLAPDSITVLIAATTRVTTTYAARTEVDRYAVTLTINTAGGGWLVYDIEPAAAGQTGDTGGDRR